MMVKNVLGLAHDKKNIKNNCERSFRHSTIKYVMSLLLYCTKLLIFKKYILLLVVRQNMSIIMYKLMNSFDAKLLQ